MKQFLFLSFIMLCFACTKKSSLDNYYECDVKPNFKEYKTVKDFKKIFSLGVPKQWKTNIYFDDAQSSIQIADTTKNLTSSSLIGVSVVHSSITINKEFKDKILEENSQNGLENLFSEITIFKEKPTLINIAKGKKGNYSYQLTNIFTQLNDANFIQISTEVYGDSLVPQRFCEALFLIDKIQLN